MSSLLLYSTPGCHLCEEAEKLLVPVLAYINAGRAEPVLLTVQDIADSEALVEQYGLRIPVLKCAGREEELGWPFDQALAFSFIQSCPGI